MCFYLDCRFHYVQENTKNRDLVKLSEVQANYFLAHSHLICNILNAILEVSVKCQDTEQNN